MNKINRNNKFYNPTPDPSNGYRSHVAVISPHPDDAIFSMGGTIRTILDDRCHVDIINCFSFSAYSLKLPRCNNGVCVTQSRMNEESRARLQFPGMRPSLYFLHLIDAPLRRPGQSSVFRDEPLSSADREVATSLSALFHPFLAQCDTVFVPLSIGNHVDHQIARLAAELSVKSNTVRLFYYEDQPYMAKSTPSFTGGWAKVKSFCLPIDKEFKETLLKCYPSQISQSDRRAVVEYSQQCGSTDYANERFWF